MSKTPSHPESAERPRQMPDSVPIAKSVLVAIVALAIFAVGVFFSNQMLSRETKGLLPSGPAPAPSKIGQRQIGIVNQRLFELQLENEDLRGEQQDRLTTYGWVDRDKHLIHIPIESAMERLIAGSKR